LKEQLAETLAALVTSILTQPRGRVDAEEAAEPPLRQIIDMLEQVMCKHDAEKRAISLLEIWEESYREERRAKFKVMASMIGRFPAAARATAETTRLRIEAL
jgi:hypothetical protein